MVISMVMMMACQIVVPEMCSAFKSYKTIDDNHFHDNDDDDDATMTTMLMI